MNSTLKARLLQAKESLHGWYDALNQAWREAEEVITSLNVGRGVAVLIAEEEPEYDHPPGSDQVVQINVPHCTYLSFAKLHGHWQLCLRVVPVEFDWDEEDHGSWNPVSQCSKEDRVRAAHHLPDLLAQVIAEAEKVAAEVEGAVGLLKEALTPFKT